MRKAIPIAEKWGVSLCIENVRATFLKTGEEMARFIDSFDSPFVRSYFDIGNSITWTEQSAGHWAQVLGRRIYKLDIKDRGHPEFGDAKLKRAGITTGTDGGEVNWVEVREELNRVSFSGWATAEVTGGDRKRLAGIAGWMRDVLDLV
ncbi:MAG: TIM barrel protein [Pirellulales bacterium]|nr:TIM barrel protein [Pirellulales bacterium]